MDRRIFMLRTSNPVLNEKAFQGYEVADRTMTIMGTVHKSLILVGLLMCSAVFSWSQVANGTGQMWMVVGLIGGFVLAMVTIFVKQASPYTAPLYALTEGLFLGGISALFEGAYQGIVMQAVGLTFGTLFCMLLAYRSGMIRATEKFKLGVAAATGAVFFVYLVSIIMNLFGLTMPFIHSTGPLGIGISLVIIVIAALNLILDFDLIENGERYGAPKYMEWYASFGLLVTLIWLYLEILRLLSKLQRR